MSRTVEPNLINAVGAAVHDAAQRIMMPRYRTLAAHEIEIKSKGEVVTAVDRAMEDALTGALQTLDPGVRIVGEEAVELGQASIDDLHSGRLWLVDPLDGTANFAEGRGPFGVIIALVEDGSTIASWLYDPVRDELATATVGGGSFIGGRRVTVSADPIDRPIVAIAGQFMSQMCHQGLSNRALENMELRPIPRCAAAHYPMLADGQHDIAIFQRTLPWDHAGGALFLKEAGGCVTRWNGQPYRLNDDAMGIVAAASPEIWEHAMRRFGDDLARIEAKQTGTVLSVASR